MIAGSARQNDKAAATAGCRALRSRARISRAITIAPRSAARFRSTSKSCRFGPNGASITSTRLSEAILTNVA